MIPNLCLCCNPPLDGLEADTQHKHNRESGESEDKMDNNNNENAVAEIVKAAEKNESKKWDYSTLPVVQSASVHIARNKRDGDTVTASGYIVYVQVGGKWRTANEVLHFHGFKTATAVYTDKAKAEAYIKKITETWGHEVKKAEKKATARKTKAQAQLEALAAALGMPAEELAELAKKEQEKKAAA